MQHKLLIFVGLLTVIGGVILLKRTRGKQARWHIGIVQTASHPALDAVRKGFMDELDKLLPGKVDITIRNGQGSIDQMHAIAQSFAAKSDFDAFFAVATPAVQALYAVEKRRPLVIAAVSQPESLGIAAGSVTGVSDKIDARSQVALIRSLTPQVKKVAVLYNQAEPNAVATAQPLIDQLQQQGFQPLRASFTNEMELIPALEAALPKVDALLTPIDNSVALAIQLIISKALAAHKPLFVSDNLLVNAGALAARGVDYEEHGRQAAHSMVKILQGKKPHELPIKEATGTQLVINNKTLQALGLQIPDDLKGAL